MVWYLIHINLFNELLVNLIKPLLRTANSEISWNNVEKLLSSMKIHIPKHINFAPDSFMYKTFFSPILYNCFVPSGKALGFSEQRDGEKKQAWNLRKN